MKEKHQNKKERKKERCNMFETGKNERKKIPKITVEK